MSGKSCSTRKCIITIAQAFAMAMGMYKVRRTDEVALKAVFLFLYIESKFGRPW